jgi:ribonuclease J
VSSVRVHLLGGLNEIGGNKFLVEDDGERVLLDFGMSFGARKTYFDTFLQPRTTNILTDLLELDLLPHVDGLYREDLVELAWTELDDEPPESAEAYEERTGEPFVHGVLLTHAHLDHYGDISFLDPDIPVHCTATTQRMLEAINRVGRGGVDNEIVEVCERSLEELGGGAYFPGDLDVKTSRREREIKTCPEAAEFTVGPFDVRAVPVDHSVPGAVAFHVTTPSGVEIFYTGDLRFHGRLTTRTQRLRSYAEDLEPDLLLAEGTRITDAAAEDEAGVERDVAELLENCPGLGIAEFGWKDTTRFDTIQQVAETTDRTLVVDPRTAYLLHQLDHRQDVPSRSPERYDNVEVYLLRRGTMRYQPSDYTRQKHEVGYKTEWDKETIQSAWKADDEVTLRDPLAHLQGGVRAKELRENPTDYLLHLSYWSIQELVDIDPPPGSRWIRCSTEPFNEEMALDVDRQRNWLDRFGIDHNLPETRRGPPGTLTGLTHVSGHAAGADLAEFYRSMRADRIVPIHTEQPRAFTDVQKDVVLFEDKGFADAARGEAVVEV